VQLTVAGEDLLAELGDHGAQPFGAGRDRLSSEHVGIDDGEVARTEARGDRALARADPAGQTEHLGGHAAQPTAGRASWPSAIVAGARLLAFERGRSWRAATRRSFLTRTQAPFRSACSARNGRVPCGFGASLPSVEVSAGVATSAFRGAARPSQKPPDRTTALAVASEATASPVFRGERPCWNLRSYF